MTEPPNDMPHPYRKAFPTVIGRGQDGNPVWGAAVEGLERPEPGTALLVTADDGSSWISSVTETLQKRTFGGTDLRWICATTPRQQSDRLRAPPPSAADGEPRININLYNPPPEPQPSQPPVELHKKWAAFGLWCICLTGFCGIHRLYLGRYFTGILWLCTLGLLGVGQLCDLVRMKTLVRKSNESLLRDSMVYAQLSGAAGSRARALPREKRGETNEQILLKAAQANGGSLTIAQGVMASGLTFEQVEKSLREMVAKGYVDVDNEPGSGVVIYRFAGLG